MKVNLVSININAFAIIAILIFTGCSGSKTPSIPVMPSDNSNQFPVAVDTADARQEVIAAYDVSIDPDSETVRITPEQRLGAFHFPLTQLYPNVLSITGFWWKPIFHVFFKLSHPVPGSGIDLYDPRVIAILPARPDVSFGYPIFNCIGNNSVVVDPDGYTKLYDELGGSIAGNTNPFKSYFKDQPYRVWSSTGVTSETQQWNLDLKGFGGPINYKMVVVISTNYPNPSQPVVDNTPEPIILKTVIAPGLEPSGGNAKISVTFLDWQGESEIKCKVECPDLFSSAIELFYEEPGLNPNEYIFSGTISNAFLAPEGDYDLLVAAWDIPTGIHIFQEVKAKVREEISFNPSDITPPWLGYKPNDVFVSGNYAYIAGGKLGLHIFDISDPVNPEWVSWVDTPGYCYDVVISEGYAYVPDGISNGLQIIDIAPPESAFICKAVPIDASVDRIAISDGYAYLGSSGYSTNNFIIVDIDPLNSAHTVNQLSLGFSARCIAASNGYAYVCGLNEGMLVMDVDPPESAFICNTVADMGDLAFDMMIYGNYVLVADCWEGLRIVDISIPESAYLYNTVTLPGRANDVSVSNGYAYIPTYNIDGLQILDIEPLDSAKLVKSITTPDTVVGVDCTAGYAYATDYDFGRLYIIDVEPFDSSYIEKIIETTIESQHVDASGNYAGHLKRGAWFFNDLLQIVDIHSPESSQIVKTFDTPGSAQDVQISNGYAYVADAEAGLQILDIDPPESTYIVKTISTSGEAIKVFVSDGYAYVSLDNWDFQIIDIDPPESAYLANSIELPNETNGIFVYEGYAYVALGHAGLYILDIDPPESAYILRALGTPANTYGVSVFEGYAYVADYEEGLQIVDIDPPELANIVKTVSSTSDATDVVVKGGYAFLSTGLELKIIDVEPPESAYIANKVYSMGASCISLSDKHAYLTFNYEFDLDRLKIIKLW